MAPPASPQPGTTNAHRGDIRDIARHRTLALSENEDNPDIRRKYRPFLLDDGAVEDWVSTLELTTVLDMAEKNLQMKKERLKVLVLYGSLRRRSYSRLVALEASRILFRLGCDVRVFNPESLPVKNDIEHDHPKVQELRELSNWSDGHVWVSPEQHGNLVSLPLSYLCPPIFNRAIPYFFFFFSSSHDTRLQFLRTRLTGFP